MFQNKLRVILILLVVSLLPSSFQSANAGDILWNPGIGNDLFGAGSGLVPGAGIRNTGLLVNKSNPDELIMKIIMSESFEDMPFSGKGRNMAMWIYWPRNYCWGKDTANCEGLFTVGVPFNPSSYPSAKSSEYVFVQKHEKASNVNVTATKCKAPWWIDSTYKSRDTWAFAVSITCLGIPKEFGWYAFSQINIGQKDVVSDFTQVQTISYPFWDLAASAAAKNTESNSLATDNTQICVSGTVGTGTNQQTLEAQCTENSSWEFSYCNSSPLADLQVYRSKTWRKIKTVKGIKDNTTCEDSTRPYLFNFTNTSLTEKFRIKNYGNKKYKDSYMNLEIN
jgi:hypothetical protein